MIRAYDGNTPKIPASAYVDPTAAVIGQVELGEKVSIWCNVTLRGDFGPIFIGNNSNVQDNSVFHTDLGSSIHIGEGVSIGHGAIIHGADIGDNTLIGMGAIILDGAKIGKNCLIGAGALVAGSKVIPDGSLVLGLPGKVVRPTTEAEIVHTKENAQDYELRRQLYKAQAEKEESQG